MRNFTIFLNEIIRKPINLSIVSKYTVMSGFIYIMTGILMIILPEMTQIIFRDRAFVGDEQSLVRVIGLTVVVIGWFYLFGGRSGARQFVAASVVNRLTFVPLVLIVLAINGVFPHLLLSFVFLDGALALGAWVILNRLP